MNRSKLTLKLIFSTFVFGILLSAPDSAHAVNGWDSKYWGGALCVPYGNTPHADYSVRGDGIQNINAGHDRWVVCALTRDSEDAMGPQGSASIEISGTRAAAGSIDCMLTKGDAYMPPMTTLVRSTPYWTGIWSVSFATADLYSSGSATLTVTCRLPPKAQLTRVRISENNSTGPEAIP
ncbi:hypothetical protein M2650_09460 [Luteimonas sp. SX5]|uniref:Secreted protein n=1 Tax=Luteimonas galliterrae TaxID=2940486 RepID=A0ABT0MJ01_9GAMM|nr:hypothetical protein [Luteimonas galliterrae]MCL1634857.1 hypothetical protein [Luteimonas galliterrae]